MVSAFCGLMIFGCTVQWWWERVIAGRQNESVSAHDHGSLRGRAGSKRPMAGACPLAVAVAERAKARPATVTGTRRRTGESCRAVRRSSASRRPVPSRGYGGLLQPQGLQYVSASLTAWITQWHGFPVLAGLRNLLVGLATEQPLLLGFGLLGFALEWQRASTWRCRAALVTVALLATVMTLAAGRPPMSRLPMTLVLALGAARAVGSLWSHPVTLLGPREPRFVGIVAAGLAAALVLITLRSATHSAPRETRPR